MATADVPGHNLWQPWLQEAEPEYRLPASLAIATAVVLQAAFAVIAWSVKSNAVNFAVVAGQGMCE